MKILNVEVYGVEQSLIRSGYPMQYKVDEFQRQINRYHELMDIEASNSDFTRGIKLGSVQPGTGHDKFLRGIRVQFDMIAPRYFWQEWDTYHYAESLSSQSTMHCLTKFLIKDMCNKYVLPSVIEEFQKLVDYYKENPTLENFLICKSNLPEGLEIGRGIDTNYAQLKTMYLQRKDHRLPEWREVICPWMLELPYFKELCLGGMDCGKTSN